MIEVSHLVKKFGKHVAVNDLSFSVKEGEILGFLGPNGAGKSTTMNMLTGYLSSTSGMIKINGTDILENPVEAKRNIGYLPEIPPLYTDMTVREYLNFVAGLKGVKKTERAHHIDAIIDKIEITHMQTRLIKNLSKGYKQRVGLASALIGNPKLLILDEPTVGLDPKQIIEIRELIKTLSKDHTIILSSHILSEISAICDKIMIISQGSMVALDTPENLEHLFSDNIRTVIRVHNADDAFIGALKQIEGVVSVKVLPQAEENTADIAVEAEKAFDVRETLFNVCYEQKHPLLMMHSEHISLEDIFLKATKTTGIEDKTPQLTPDEEISANPDDLTSNTSNDIQTTTSENENTVLKDLQTKEGASNEDDTL